MSLKVNSKGEKYSLCEACFNKNIGLIANTFANLFTQGERK